MATRLVNGVRVELTQNEIDARAAEIAARAVPSAIKAKRAEIEKQYKAGVNQITAGYDNMEIASWPQQADEAKARNENSQASAPLIDAIAQARGMTSGELVTRILGKEAIYKQAFGAILGTRQRRTEQLSAVDVNAGNALDIINAV